MGALDAVAYRQLTGCNPKLVAKELAGIKDQGLMIQKGRARGTYYVPSEKLLETSQPSAANTIPPVANTTPLATNTTPAAANTIPLPKDLKEDLAKLKLWGQTLRNDESFGDRPCKSPLASLGTDPAQSRVFYGDPAKPL